ncbi:metal-dependent transcriptional regulator [Anaerovorax sp. IOR16]|uniref:metal-dependent transcriptional regulator n=1 Tax=Anaerovorax sp. IOR16 TaxID=2773458 RepID=UPI0019D04097|nr:metal-dependent transcriptional regulator [Anaerovorax sp. IOR16]
MKLQESGENYLETILLLEKEKGTVRSVDIANKLDFTKASISRAMSILKREEYITVESGGNIVLTEKGRERAKGVYEKHRLIAQFLIEALEVTQETAEQDACRIEHIISEETFSQMKLWLETAASFDDEELFNR